MQFPDITVDAPIARLELAEPPRILAVPEPVRERSWRSFRQSVREVPSWMTSLVVHMLCFLLLMSVTSRAVSVSGSSPLVLKLSLGEELETSSVIEVEVPQSSPKTGDTSDLPDGLEASDMPPERLSPPSELPNEVEPSPTRTTFMSPSSLAIAPSKYAGLTMRLRNRTTRTSYSRLESANRSNDPAQQHFDQVVDRFIEYDIGKLRGEAGVRANRAFHNLGAEAFPALIRGLNRSADIHASCPVGVIAGKVLNILRNSNDPSLAEYASRHIGEGVAPNAPHYRRIEALRDRYVGPGASAIPERVAKILNERGAAGNGETLELALSLAESPMPTLNAALRSHDEDLAFPAAVALLQRASQLNRSDKRSALRTLATRDMTGVSDDYKSLVADSMAALSGQLDAERARLKQIRKQNQKASPVQDHRLPSSGGDFRSNSRRRLPSQHRPY